MQGKIVAAVKEVRERSRKRNFSQSFDLIVNLKNLDVKKAENRISESLALPNGKGRESEVVVFADDIKDVDCKVLKGSDIQALVKDKRAVKKLVGKTDFFLAEPKLMPLIGKALGQLLAPRGKMPVVITGDVKPMIKRCKKSVRIKVKDSPVVHCPVGNENMADEKVAENISAVIKFLETKLPKGKNNIGKALIKLTMGKPVKIEV